MRTKKTGQVKYIVLAFVQLLAISFSKAELLQNRLRPFSSDGCSMVADGVPVNQWLSCCIKHDVEYWVGGSKEDKNKADLELDRCVAANSFKLLGSAFYYAVGTVGIPALPTTWRWGYGWVDNRGYQSRSNEDQNQVNRTMGNIISFLSNDKLVKDFSRDELYCTDSEENLEIRLSLYENYKANGLLKAKESSLEKEISGLAFSTIVNLNSAVEIVQFQDNLNKEDNVSINLVPSSDCIIEKSNERLPFQGIILNHTENSKLVHLLKNKKICCEKLKNNF